MARVIVPERWGKKRRVGAACGASPAPCFLSGRRYPVAVMLTAADTTRQAPGGFHRLHSRATDVERRGDVSAGTASFLEGIEPQVEAVDATCAVSESLGKGIALPLFAPLPGVVATVVDDLQGLRS